MQFDHSTPVGETKQNKTIFAQVRFVSSHLFLDDGGGKNKPESQRRQEFRVSSDGQPKKKVPRGRPVEGESRWEEES